MKEPKLDKSNLVTLMTKEKPEPMPCRGCMPDCKNRKICNGRPWRMKVLG